MELELRRPRLARDRPTFALLVDRNRRPAQLADNRLRHTVRTPRIEVRGERVQQSKRSLLAADLGSVLCDESQPADVVPYVDRDCDSN